MMTADARAEAIQMIERLLVNYYDSLGAFYSADNCPSGFTPGDPMTDADEAKYLADLIASAVLSPRVVPCSECGGKGWVSLTYADWDCPAGCDHGQVSLPPLAVLMGELEQVAMGSCTKCGWYGPLGEVDVEVLASGISTDIVRRLHPRCNYAAVDAGLVFRLRTPGT